MNRRNFLKGTLLATATLAGCKAVSMPNVLEDKPIEWEANKIAPKLYGKPPTEHIMTATEVLERQAAFFLKLS